MRMRVGGGVLSAVLTYTHIHTHPPAHGKKAVGHGAFASNDVVGDAEGGVEDVV